jgi:hypothetical protein
MDGILNHIDIAFRVSCLRQSIQHISKLGARLRTSGVKITDSVSSRVNQFSNRPDSRALQAMQGPRTQMQDLVGTTANSRVQPI